MLRLYLIFIACICSIQQDGKLNYSNGKPTTMGIDWYVNNKENQREFIAEYQKIIKDSLYNDIYFRTESIDNDNVLAYNQINANECEIVVDNHENYRAFVYNSNNDYYDNDYFLKATVMHEISHYYFYQVMVEMQKILHLKVNEYYTTNLYIYPNRELQYGAKFIEEGFCTYIIQRFKYSHEYANVKIPKISELLNKKLDFDIQYLYASKVLWNFFDTSIALNGSVKEALLILLSNKPPNYMEIINTNLYFDRLANRQYLIAK